MNPESSESDCNEANCDDESFSEIFDGGDEIEQADDDYNLSFRTLDSFKLHNNKLAADNPPKRLSSVQGMELQLSDDIALSFQSTITSHGSKDDGLDASSSASSDGSFSAMDHEDWAFTASAGPTVAPSKQNHISATERMQPKTCLNQYYPFESTNPIYASPNRQAANNRAGGGVSGRISPRNTFSLKNFARDEEAAKSLFADAVTDTKIKTSTI